MRGGCGGAQASPRKDLHCVAARGRFVHVRGRQARLRMYKGARSVASQHVVTAGRTKT